MTTIHPTAWVRGQLPTDVTGRPMLAAKALLYALADYADKDGLCYPSRQTLASVLGLSVRRVDQAFRVLKDGGYVSKKPRALALGGRTSDYTTLNLGRPPDLSLGRPQPWRLSEASA